MTTDRPPQRQRSQFSDEVNGCPTVSSSVLIWTTAC